MRLRGLGASQPWKVDPWCALDWKRPLVCLGLRPWEPQEPVLAQKMKWAEEPHPVCSYCFAGLATREGLGRGFILSACAQGPPRGKP